ncbi:SDR family NAD(P)-dependent oxidoreductase [Pedobacter chinensis]|uniref:SDR family NAD(P)-dependent oxidoreductase n=1 Tax=Pedobacter chinensis TaxID=2282421 RepID=A0A369PTU6_9SPHI|nr:oxidoreductase [Pedobacter chinensis]RDC55954.1 SDR family NAD(P)-dependent oxidoreductase [Pedobacter chinensis]
MDTNKTWFITGASRGFGFEITKAALADGHKVIATVRKGKEQLAAQFNSNNLLVIEMDVTDEGVVNTAVNEALARFGKIDVLVNNAGFGLLSAVEEGSDSEIRNMYETNVFGLLKVLRAVLPHFRSQHSGHVINISSVGGLTGSAGWGLYNSTKFAVEGLTEALAKELAPLGIYATAVEPGYFRTNFLDGSSLTTAKQVIDDYAETSGKMRSYAPDVSYRQPGDPAKLAKAILKIVEAEQPPVHLPLGNDTLKAYRTKTASFELDIQDWLDVVTGTDHDDVHQPAVNN